MRSSWPGAAAAGRTCGSSMPKPSPGRPYRCKTPLISAIGHEIDYTILDFVADQRAPTPSAAAELAVPDRQVLRARLYELEENMHRNMQKRRDLCYNTCKAYADALAGDPAATETAPGQRAAFGPLRSAAGGQPGELERKRPPVPPRRSSGSLAQPLSGAGAGGYAMVAGADGKIRQADQLAPGDTIRLVAAHRRARVPGDGSGGDR